MALVYHAARSNITLSSDKTSTLFYHRSHGPVVDGLLENPAELLHLAPHHFATGWTVGVVELFEARMRVNVLLLNLRLQVRTGQR